jgi:hypothetical protein
VICAIVIAVGYVLGKVEGSNAVKIIIGCVGASAVAGVVAKTTAKKSKPAKKKK